MAETMGLESRRFDLEIITPLFLGGADGETPELRAPSFKGCMRYWWRAAVAETDIKELARREGELFGSSAEGAGKSPLSIRILATSELGADKNKVDERPLPHSDRKKFTLKGLRPGLQFTLCLNAGSDLELYSDILELALILGGIGKRSRRGFGSVGVKGWDFSDQASLIDYIHEKLETITEQKGVFETRDETVRGKVIVRRNPPPQQGKAYPWIEEVFIGKEKEDWKSLVKTIGQATHKFHDPSLGNASPRMASPIYVSAVIIGRKYAPVVTTLKANFPTKYPKCDTKMQNSFKGEL